MSDNLSLQCHQSLIIICVMISYLQGVSKTLLLGRKVIANLDSILKNRDITLSTKACLVKAMVFPVVLYECELYYKES